MQSAADVFDHSEDISHPMIPISNDARTMSGKKRKRKGQMRGRAAPPQMPIPPRHLKSQKNKQQNEFGQIVADENDDEQHWQDQQNQQSQNQTQQHWQDQRRSLYKTELCREWMASGWCYYDHRCSFAHSMSELRPVYRSKNWRTKRCRNWHTTGYCPYEHRCQFLHEQAPPHSMGSDAPSVCPTVPMPNIKREMSSKQKNRHRAKRAANNRGNHESVSMVNVNGHVQEPLRVDAKKSVARRASLSAQSAMQNSHNSATHNSNARALCEAQQRMPPLYFHYNVEAKAERNGNPPRLQVTPYTVDATAMSSTNGLKDTHSTTLFMPMQPTQRVDGVAEMELKRNLKTLSLSQSEQRGLTVEVPPSLTPSINSDSDDMKADDDTKNRVDGISAAQGTAEVDVDAMDRKLHLKMTEQSQKMTAMHHRVESMKRARSVVKMPLRDDDDDDRKENVTVHGTALPFADMLQYMLPTAISTPTVAATAPLTSRRRMNLLSPRPATTVNMNINAQTATQNRREVSDHITALRAMSDYTPQINLPFNISMSPSMSLMSPRPAQTITTPRTPISTTVPQSMTWSMADHRAQIMAAQSQVTPIRALPPMTAPITMPSVNAQAQTVSMMDSMNAFSIFDGTFSMSPDLPPIPDPSQYLSNLPPLRNSF